MKGAGGGMRYEEKSNKRRSRQPSARQASHGGGCVLVKVKGHCTSVQPKGSPCRAHTQHSRACLLGAEEELRRVAEEGIVADAARGSGVPEEREAASEHGHGQGRHATRHLSSNGRGRWGERRLER